MTRLQAGWSGVWIPAWERHVSSPKQQGLDPAKPPGCLPLRVKRLAMKLTTHLHPVLTLRMSGAIPPWSLYAFLFQSAYVNITPLDALKGAMVSFTILTKEMDTHSLVMLGEVGREVLGRAKTSRQTSTVDHLFLSLSSPEFNVTLRTIQYADSCSTTRPGWSHVMAEVHGARKPPPLPLNLAWSVNTERRRIRVAQPLRNRLNAGQQRSVPGRDSGASLPTTGCP